MANCRNLILLFTFLLIASVANAKIPHNLVIEDCFDAVEINHHYDSQTGDLLFDQIIFLNNDFITVVNNKGDYEERFKLKVEFWFLLKGCRKYGNTTKIHKTNEEYVKVNKKYQEEQLRKLIKHKRQQLLKYYSKHGPIAHKIVEEKLKKYNPKLTNYIPPFSSAAFKLVKTDNGYRIVFHYEKQLYKISFKTFSESWTMTDPELENRKFFAKSGRKGLTSSEILLKFGKTKNN